jgi:Vault protein inter-alpha-trypsin domain
MFPTDPDQNTVVSKIVFEMGDKRVESKITEKEKAKERYEDAIAGGHAAVLFEESEKDKDLLKMTLGGIQPT